MDNLNQPLKIRLLYDLQQQMVPDSRPVHPVIPLPTERYKEIGQAFLDAYRDTIDYEGESLDDAIDEVSRVINGGYGPLAVCASGAILVEGNIAAAVFVSIHNDTPFIPYVITSKEFKGRGMAGELLRYVLRRLSEAGYKHVELYVTKGNLPAEKLYENLGFYSVD